MFEEVEKHFDFSSRRQRVFHRRLVRRDQVLAGRRRAVRRLQLRLADGPHPIGDRIRSERNETIESAAKHIRYLDRVMKFAISRKFLL